MPQVRGFLKNLIKKSTLFLYQKQSISSAQLGYQWTPKKGNCFLVVFENPSWRSCGWWWLDCQRSWVWDAGSSVCHSHGSVCYACDCKLYRGGRRVRNEICNNIRDQVPRFPPQNLWQHRFRFVVSSWTIWVLPFYCKYFAFQQDGSEISEDVARRGCVCAFPFPLIQMPGISATIVANFRYMLWAATLARSLSAVFMAWPQDLWQTFWYVNEL